MAWQADVPWLLLPGPQPSGCETHLPSAPVHLEVGPQPVLGMTGCMPPVVTVPLIPTTVPLTTAPLPTTVTVPLVAIAPLAPAPLAPAPLTATATLPLL